VIANAYRLPIAEGSTGLATAWLFDPFNQAGFYREARRILTLGGELIGTLPTVTWGHLARPALGMRMDETKFEMATGELLVVDSWLSNVSELEVSLEMTGFGLTDISHGFIGPDTDHISPHVTIAAEQIGVSPFDLPLVLAFTATAREM
jgi:hypothetical protein